MRHAEILELVLESLRGVLAERGDAAGAAAPPAVDADTPLIGQRSVLDSLGLVELIVEVEQRLDAERGVAVTLADERAMSQRHSPFRSPRTLADYVVALVEGREDRVGA